RIGAISRTGDLPERDGMPAGSLAADPRLAPLGFPRCLGPRHHAAGTVDRGAHPGLGLLGVDAFENHRVVPHAPADESSLTRESGRCALADHDQLATKVLLF